MGNIMFDGKTFVDRRSKNGRLRLDTGDWIRIVSIAIVVILGWGNVKWDVEAQSKVLNKHEEQIKTTSDMALATKTDVVNIKERVERIDNNVITLLQKIR